MYVMLVVKQLKCYTDCCTRKAEVDYLYATMLAVHSTLMFYVLCFT